MVMRTVMSWGRLSRRPHEWLAVRDRRELARAVTSSRPPGLAFGNGRSYGDACLNAGGVLWAMRGADRFIDFDPVAGVVECEAGVLLKEIIELALASGWFLPVVPGTEFVTVGGAIANDVHGKNHHRAGTFGTHVESLELLRTDGRRIRCGAHENLEWFAATVGGLGLTGVIASARLRLRRVPSEWLDVESESFDSLDDFFELSQRAAVEQEYSVAWVDCAAPGARGARGVLFRADHGPSAGAAPAARLRAVAIEPPLSLVNGPTLRAFNRLYRARHRGRSQRRQHYRSFFFPLDGIGDWNRIYGPRGFYQYQCVVPALHQHDAVLALLAAIAASGTGSFLAVLKTFGDVPSPGLLSFATAGTTLALDFPNRGDATLDLFATLDAIVAEAGGRLYVAKDARMPQSLFRSGYPRFAEFESYRDPGISSEMSRRLFDR